MDVLSLSYMEIYNEKVRDLLVEQGKRQTLRVREHPREGPYVEGLGLHEVKDYHSIAALLKVGNSHRATASTTMNDASSRSHAIFSLVLTQVSEEREPLECVALVGGKRCNVRTLMFYAAFSGCV